MQFSPDFFCITMDLLLIPSAIISYKNKHWKTITMNNTIDTAASNDIFSSAFLLGNVGAPFVIGMAVGYFAKKMLRTALFLGGAAIVLMFVGEYYGITSISDINLQNAANAATEAVKSSGGFLIDRVTRITSKGVSGAGGFFVGFKLG